MWIAILTQFKAFLSLQSGRCCSVGILTIGWPGSENFTWISFKCFRMGSSCSWRVQNRHTGVKKSGYKQEWDARDRSIHTCSMSLSMSTLLNMVSQNSGMPLGSSSGAGSSFFTSTIAAFSLTSSCRQSTH